MAKVHKKPNHSELATITNDNQTRVADNAARTESVHTFAADDSQLNMESNDKPPLDDKRENIQELSEFEDETLDLDHSGLENHLSRKRKTRPVDCSELIGADGTSGSPATMRAWALKRIRYTPNEASLPAQPVFVRPPEEHEQLPATSAVDFYVDPNIPRPEDPLWRLAHGWPIESTTNPYLSSIDPAPSYTASDGERVASPVYTPPSPSAAYREFSSGQLVDWTFVPDVEDDGSDLQQMNPGSRTNTSPVPAHSPAADPGSNAIGRCDAVPRRDQSALIVSDDPGYEAASEWEVMSETSLEFICRNNGGIRLVANGNNDAMQRNMPISEAPVDSEYYTLGPHAIHPSVPVFHHTPRTPSLFQPSPMNSGDHRHIYRQGSTYEPSPLNINNLRNFRDHRSYSTAGLLCSISGSPRSMGLVLSEARVHDHSVNRRELYGWNEPASPTPEEWACLYSRDRSESPSSKSLDIHVTAANGRIFRDTSTSQSNTLELTSHQDVRVPPATRGQLNGLSPVVDWTTPAFPGGERYAEVNDTFSEDSTDAVCEAIEDDEDAWHRKRLWIEKWTREVWPEPPSTPS